MLSNYLFRIVSSSIVKLLKPILFTKIVFRPLLPLKNHMNLKCTLIAALKAILRTTLCLAFSNDKLACDRMSRCEYTTGWKYFPAFLNTFKNTVLQVTQRMFYWLI